MNIKNLSIIIWLMLPAALIAQSSGSITQGLGTTTVADLMPNCPSNHITPLGTIKSSDGKNWVVPAETAFQTGAKCADLYNSCNGITPANLAAANLSNVPVVEIDPGGEIITGFLFADNYFELYINGVLVGVDAVPFTPFNSSVVKFRVSKPYTIAVKLVDWEENPGLGSEINMGNNFHPGDGGFIAQFSDGTVTDSNWKAQTFYIAPIQDLNSVIEKADGTHSTATATIVPTCGANCFGVHYPTPPNWTAANFDDSGWPKAILYNAAQVTNQAAYTNFANSAWPNAKFIWSSNLILDNEVLVRHTVGTTDISENDTSEKTKIQVAPNPFSDRIFLKNAPENAVFEITNAVGQVVFSGKNIAQTDFSGLPNGIYYLKIFLKKTKIIKLVKT
jgi:hypothetical protein